MARRASGNAPMLDSVPGSCRRRRRRSVPAAFPGFPVLERVAWVLGCGRLMGFPWYLLSSHTARNSDQARAPARWAPPVTSPTRRAVATSQPGGCPICFRSRRRVSPGPGRFGRGGPFQHHLAPRATTSAAFRPGRSQGEIVGCAPFPGPPGGSPGRPGWGRRTSRIRGVAQLHGAGRRGTPGAAGTRIALAAAAEGPQA